MRVCVILATKTKARFLSLERSGPTETPRLVERLDLVNTELVRPQHERYSSQRAEARGQIVSGGQYVLDDGRQAHDQELERKFASTIMEETGRVCRATKAGRLILCAEPQMQGLLREAAQPPNLPLIEELGVNLINVPPPEVQAHLEKKGLLRQARSISSSQWRPRSTQ